MSPYLKITLAAIFLSVAVSYSEATLAPEGSSELVQQLLMKELSSTGDIGNNNLPETSYKLNMLSEDLPKESTGSLSVSYGIPTDNMVKTHSLDRMTIKKSKRDALISLYTKYGLNKLVRRKIKHFSGQQKRTFIKRLSLSGRYISHMSDILYEKGVPQELVFLPLIESGFDPYAYSHRRASGPWQFIPATARTFNLKMDWWVDERRDPIKSTIAAADYLKNLHSKFKTWNLALAAYNAGEGKIRRSLKKVDKKSYWALQKTRLLKRETRNYVPSYIAAAAIAINPEKFGFKNIEYLSPMKFDTVTINRPMDLDVVAKLTGSNVTEIKMLNPELKRWCTPPNVLSYKLRIPYGRTEMFLTNYANIKEEESFFVQLYKVKDGDTVGKIARQLGSSIQAIIDMNELGRKAVIFKGSSIVVPVNRNWDKVLTSSF